METARVAEPYVVALQRRGTTSIVHRRAEIVDARTVDEAVAIALEGNSWETEDGTYIAYVSRLADLEQRSAIRATDTTITVRERDSRDG